MAVSYPIDVRVDPTNAVRGSRRVKNELRSTRTEASALKATVAGLFAGAAFTAAISRSVDLLADFSQEMSTVKAVTQATDKEFTALKATAETLGRTTRFSATQAAEGMTFLARAGFDADEVLGSIAGTLNLAQAGGLDLGSAADIASNALQGMRLEVDQTGRVVDVLALAANSSNTNVMQLGNAMSFVAPISSGLNVSLEQTTAAIGALSDAGIQGSSAGTGLRRVLIGLENPSKEAEKIFRSLGLTTDDLQISQVGLSAALQLLSDRGLTTAQALEVFGDRGGPAAEVLLQVSKNADGSITALDEMTRSLENANGTAERIAETMDDNLNGAILSVKSSIQGFIISMGNAGSEDALVILAQGLATGFRFAAENADVLTLAIIALAARASVPLFLPLIASANTAITTLRATTIMLGVSGAAMNAASVSARALGASLMAFAASNPVTLGITLIAGAYLLLKRNAEDASEAIGKAQGALSNYKNATAGVERDTELLKERTAELRAEMQNLGTDAQDAARLEIDAIGQRISKNEELRDSYLDVLKSQLEAAKANKTSTRDVAKNAGIDLLKSEFKPGVGFGGAGQLVFERKSDLELYDELNGKAYEYNQILESGGILTKKQSKDYRRITEAISEQKQEAFDLLNLETAIAKIKSGTFEKEKSGSFANDNTPAQANKVDIAFEDQLTALKKETEALALNTREREARNKVLKFEKELEREFSGDEQSRVEAEIARQQVLLDRTAIEQRMKDIGSESALLGINSREAEARAAILSLERDILRQLSPDEEKRLRSVIEQNQALRDDDAIQNRLFALADQADLLKKVGIEADITSEILSLQNRLERDLTETEKLWIENAIRLNDELARRNQIITDARQPNQDLKDSVASINALFQEGVLSAREYSSALRDISLANDGRDLDRELNSAGASFGPSEFELQRIKAEQEARLNEDGNAGVNRDSAYGFSGSDLGVGDELQQERDKAQERLDLLREMQDAELLNDKEFSDRKAELLRQSEATQLEILRKGASLRLSDAESIGSSVTDILANTVGEQSAIYKGAFVAQKAAAIAQSAIAIQQGIAQAAALPFPANLGAMATVAAATASIVGNIQAVRLKLMDGGHVGERYNGVVNGPGSRKSDSIPAMLSRDEFVVNGDATQNSTRTLNAINNGQLTDDDLFRRGFMNGGAVGSAPSNAFGGRSAANDRRGGTTINVGGLSISVSGSNNNPQELGQEIGEAAARALVETILAENTNQPGGIVYERIANG